MKALRFYEFTILLAALLCSWTAAYKWDGSYLWICMVMSASVIGGITGVLALDVRRWVAYDKK